MFPLRAASLTFLLGVLCACGSPHPTPDADRAALIQTSRDWAAAAASNDVERIASFWDRDAVVLPPDQPVIVGIVAIRGFLVQSMKIPGFTITWEPELAVISARGDLGYLVERNRVTFTDSTGVSHTQYGKAVTVWKKDSTGHWKCVVDTWNNSPTEHVLSRTIREHVLPETIGQAPR